MDVIRVVLAEDHALLREGISRLVETHDDLELVGAASDLPQLLEVIAKCKPDVVVTDIRMPPTGTDEGIQAAAWLREHRAKRRCGRTQSVHRPGLRPGVLEEGSAGRATCSRSASPARANCRSAIRVVAEGGSVIDPLVVDELVKARSHRPKSRP